MKKKRKKMPKLSVLKKKAHIAWSLYVRLRDGRCLMCGTTENLHAHHGVVPAGRGVAVRFLQDNGFTLCERDHIWILHTGRYTKEWLDRWVAVIDRMVSKERQEEIIRLSHEIKPPNRQDLENVIKFYTVLTSELKLRKEKSNLNLIQP